MAIRSNLDYTISVPRDFAFNSPIPSNQNNIVCDWKTSLKRCFIPQFASSQDKKVAELFINHINDFLKDEAAPANVEEVKAMLSQAEQHIAKSHHSASTSRLEHYTLVARERLNAFEPGQTQEALKEKCRLDNKAMLNRWTKAGFAEEAFWSSPDLVDFIFNAHLQRFIRHADYQHTIAMQPCFLRRGEQLAVVSEPHLLKDGRQTPWSEIRQKIKIDTDERLYSIENGQKKYWMYLNEGFTQWDRHDLDHLKPFKMLPTPPSACQVQVVTSQIPTDRWAWSDHFLKGTVHTHLRIIPRAGFSAAHPEADLRDGGVYSIGYGGRWADVSGLQLLRGIQGTFYNPDSTEYFKEDLWVTTIDDVTDEKLLQIQEIVKRRSHELKTFHIINRNCCREMTEILKEADVVDLKSEIRLDHLFYKVLVPDFIKNGIGKCTDQLSKVVPTMLASAVSYLLFIPFTLVLSPFILLLGGWNVKRPENSPADGNDGVEPMFGNIAAPFDTSRWNVSLTLNVTEWQKTQPNTVYIKQE